MIFQYGTRWLVYWISLFTGNDVENFTQKLRNLGDYIIKNIQPITQKIAKFFEIFYRLGKAGIKLLSAFGKGIIWLVDLFDSQITRTIAIVALFSKILLASPLNMFITALVLLLLLIDDYMTWQRGGESALDSSKFDESLTNLKNTLNGLKEELQPIKDLLDTIWNDFLSNLDPVEELNKLIDYIASDLEVIQGALKDINNFIKAIKEGKSLKEILGMESNFGQAASEFVQKDNLFTKFINMIARQDVLGSNSILGRLGALASNSGFFSGGFISGGNTSNQSNYQNNTINVYGDNAKSIGDEVANRLKNLYPTRLPY
nr:MAG TPA: hypothetical protein [Caudoviricetes sp.]